MRSPSPLPGLVFIVIFATGLALAYSSMNAESYVASAVIAAISFIVASIAANAVKVADQWERIVVLRLGKFRSLEGPGLFFIVPVIETTPFWIDIRVITSTFKAEKTMTQATPSGRCRRGAVLEGHRSEKAALDVADYGGAINWAAQTALRDVIGKTMLADMLEGRDKLSAELQRIIDARTEPWGVNVISVEVKDVLIPAALQDAMSMQAQAERERQARVILGDSERQVADKFSEAANTYADNPTAFHLRAMNMLYEGLKRSNATIVIVPSTAVEFDAARRRADGDDRQRHRACTGRGCADPRAVGRPSAAPITGPPRGRRRRRIRSRLSQSACRQGKCRSNPSADDARTMTIRLSEARKTDARADRELSISGADVIAGKSAARVVCDGSAAR